MKNESEKQNENKKILLVFDLDNTILTKTTDYEVFKLVSENSIREIEESTANWAKYMQQVYIKMKSESIQIHQIKEVVEKIPLNSGFREIFDCIKKRREKFEILIISGANTLYIKWIINYHNLHDLVNDYFSNHAEPDEELLIKITPNHDHQCEVCVSDLAQCKKKVLLDYFKVKGIENYQESYSNIIYVGDGENDFCPSTLLAESNCLFPRENYALYNLIYYSNYLDKLKCNIFPWENGYKIIEELKK